MFKCFTVDCTSIDEMLQVNEQPYIIHSVSFLINWLFFHLITMQIDEIELSFYIFTNYMYFSKF